MAKAKAIDCGFKKGDVVRLKSGGPNMTVTSVDIWKPSPPTALDSDLARYLPKEENSARRVPAVHIDCTWFRGAHKMSGTFDPETIDLVPDLGKKKAPRARSE